jgi:PAS domain S-box-containing protein
MPSSQEYAESIIDTVREPLIVLDQDLRVITASRSFYEVFKTRPEETLGQLVYDLGNKQWDIPRLRDLLETILPQRAAFDDYEVEHNFAAIGRRIMLLNARQVQRVQGKERIILLAIEDVTARRRAEAEGQKLRKRFEDIVQFLPDATFVVDQDGVVVAWNQAMETMTGIKAEDSLGRGDYAYAIPFYGEARPLLIDIARGAVAANELSYVNLQCRPGHVFAAEIAVKKLFGHEDGYVSAIAAPLYDEVGKLVGAIESVRDITERRETEDRLKRIHDDLEALTTELKHATRAKSEFLANMSHELRTPLTAILGFADLMSRDLAISGQPRENLAIIIRSGEHLLALINDILDLSKIEAGRIEIDRQDIDLGELIRDIINMMRGRAEAKGLRLVLDQSSEFPRFVNTDPGKFRQILVNLVGNAIKFTQAGQISIKLNVDAVPDSHVLIVEIQDTGIGISRDDLDRLFHPFEQIGIQTTVGTGLGLAITRQYVQMLGGQISVDSEPGQGSCFHFTLPVGCVSLANAQTLPVRRHPVGIGSPTADLRLLIVEDHPENRLLLRCYLEFFNFQLREVINGQEAIAMFQKWHPHLIFMDRRMPVLNGLEATRQIKALPGGDETIIIAVSAHSFKEEQREMLEAGCTDFLVKPFGTDDLLALLKKHLHLDLVYADDEKLPATAPRPLSTDDLRVLPPAALATLYRLALEGDDSELEKWLEVQASLAPVAKEALASLIKDYRFEVIQEIVRPLVQGKTG